MSDKANWVGTTEVVEGNVQHQGAVRVKGGAAASGFSICDPTDSTKVMIFDLSGLSTGTTDTFTPSPGGAEVTVDGTQSLTNKSLDDTTTLFFDTAGPTKLGRFELTGVTAGQTRVMTWPNFDGTLSTLAGTETLTNKTLTTPALTTPAISSGGTLSGTLTGGTLAPTTLTVPASTALTTPTLTTPAIASGGTLSGTLSGGTLAPTTLTVPASTALATPALTAPTVATSLLITSTTGALGVPVMTEAQRDALTPAAGWLVYNSTTNKLNVRVAAAWEVITSI